jgi:hypothetical protein
LSGPTDLIGFVALPDEGCELAPIGLARYPAALEYEGQRIPTNLDGWCWQGLVKTHYGSNVLVGGIKHFLRCHLGTISLPNRAKELGILERANDKDNHLAERGNIPKSRRTGSQNRLIIRRILPEQR